MVIDIDNHIMNSGCYKMFTNWLESLAVEQPRLPKGFLFLAFDNDTERSKELPRLWMEYGHVPYCYKFCRSQINPAMI